MGASSGLGLASAEALAAEGAKVTLVGRRRDLLEREAERIGGLAVRGDVTVPRDLEHAVEQAVAAFDGIDILVWNGGGPPPGTGLDVTPESLEQAVELLVQPAVRLVNLCLPHLERSVAGRIIAITSIAALEPSGITVNCVAPGRIATARLEHLYPSGPTAENLEDIPLRRWGEPRELGD